MSADAGTPLFTRLVDAVTGRSCLVDQDFQVVAILGLAFAVVLASTAISVFDRKRAADLAPDGPARRTAMVGFVLYTAGSAALFILYGLFLAEACRRL